MALIDRLKSKLQIPEWKAFLDLISWAEGSNYNTLFTGRTFSNYNDHPNIFITSGSITSSASGRYQIMDFTWKRIKPKIPLSDFTPLSQDIAAIYLILIVRNVKENLIENYNRQNLTTAIQKVGNEWASFGYNTYEQPVKQLNSLISKYEEFLEKRKNGQEVDTEGSSSEDTSSNNNNIPGDYSNNQNFIPKTEGIVSVLLTANAECEAPKFSQKSFLFYPGCLAKVASPKISNIFQLGASAPAMSESSSSSTDLEAPSFINEEEVLCLVKQGDLISPLAKSFGITSPFLDPERPRIHKGVDVATPVGTPIYASCEGIITVVSFEQNGAGKYLSLKSSNNKYAFNYFHLSKVLVRQGDKVKKGQKIAETGNTGSSSGPHLHLEFYINNRLTDAAKYFVL